MTSWLVMGYIASEAQWFEQVQWVVQSQKETKSFELVDYARQLYRYQEPWMKARVKIVEDSAGHIRLSNGSEIIGIPAGESQIRSYHPTGYLMDEASHLPEAQQCYGVAEERPGAGRPAEPQRAGGRIPGVGRVCRTGVPHGDILPRLGRADAAA